MLTWGKTMVDFAARLIQLRNHEHHLLQLLLGHQHQQQLRHPRQYLCHPTAKRCNLMERLCETRCLLTTVTLENNACPAKLGLTFLDKNGNTANSDGISTWQFNFKFNLTEDMYAEESVELLRNSGIQFERHEQVYLLNYLRS